MVNAIFRLRKRILTFLLILLGISYLFFYANSKFYWHDEVSIFLHLSGYSSQELVGSLYDGQVKNKADIQQFQGVNAEHDLDQTLKLVAKSSSHQPPLYITLLWIWAKLWGNSEIALRSLSVIIWAIFLVIIYHLVNLLSHSSITTILSMLFIAISPRFFNYSLDVWEYGLFSLLIALSSYLFIKYLHSNFIWQKWIAYGLSLMAGLYTHIFFSLVILSHSCYLGINRFYYSRQQKQYFIKVIIVSLLSFTPWLWIIKLDHQPIYAWSIGNWQLSDFYNSLIRDFYGLFSSFSYSQSFYNVSLILLLIILITSLGILIKKGSLLIRSFLLLMITVPLITLLLVDIVGQSKYSYVGRFYLPTFIGILITIALAITQMLNHSQWRGLGFCIIIFILWLGLQSQWLQLSHPYYMGYGSQIMNSALIINQSNQPLVVGEKWLDIIPLSYKIKPNAQYLFIKDSSHLSALNADSAIYVLTPSKKLRQFLQSKDFMLKSTDQKSLWLAVHNSK